MFWMGVPPPIRQLFPPVVLRDRGAGPPPLGGMRHVSGSRATRRGRGGTRWGFGPGGRGTGRGRGLRDGGGGA